MTPAWLATGTALFCIAIATPLFLLNYLPQVNALEATSVGETTEAAVPLAVEADTPNDYPEIVLAASAGQVGEEMGSLATLIDKQGADLATPPGSAVRRMILDAVAVDLESSEISEVLEHVRVPILDCDVVGNTPDGWLIDDADKLTSALHSLQTGWTAENPEPIAGPAARIRALTHEGMRIEYCPDLKRIHAVALLPLPPGPEPVAAMAAVEMVLPIMGRDDGVTHNINTDSRLQASSKLHQMVVAKVSDVPVEPGIGVLPEPIERSDHSREKPSKPVGLASVDVAPAQQTVSVTTLIDPSIATPIGTVANAPSNAVPVERIERPRLPSGDAPRALLALNGEAFGISTDVSPATTAAAHNTPQQVAVISPALPELRTPGSLESVTVLARLEASKQELRLNKSARWRTQLRLTLIGHDPKGIDGIFGTGTRDAIAALQSAEALPATGYLDAKTLAVLKQKSGRRYAKWRERRQQLRAERAAQELAAAVAPQKVSNAPVARSAPGCARDNRGIIISNQSFGCDLNVLREGLGSLFGSSS